VGGKMKRFIFLVMVIMLFLTSCEAVKVNISAAEYKKITSEEAKMMIDSEKDIIILDVRSQSEYDEGHIKNAILIPDTEIEKMAPINLADKNAKILVYCRSGRRSELASKKLIEMGYTNVIDFGGIIDWKYDIVK
jgi:phage shock protein E